MSLPTSSIQSDYSAQAAPQLSPIGTLPDASFYGNPGGGGYNPANPPLVSVTRSTYAFPTPSFDAALRAVIGTTTENQGSVIGVDILFGGSNYEIGDLVTFTGGDGTGATAIVTGVTGLDNGTYTGAITRIGFPPTGIPQQILGMISGTGMPTLYVTQINPATVYNFPNQGVIGAFNDKVNGYYNQSLMYQNQIEDIVACLNAVSAPTPGASGVVGTSPIGTILSTWMTYSIETAVTGTTYTNYYSTTVDSNMSVAAFLQTYATITLSTESGTNGQQYNIQIINSGLSPYQSKLGTANSFLNSAVTSLQSQISQFSQIVSQFFNAVQGAAGNIR
jgi:hypothetical protein